MGKIEVRSPAQALSPHEMPLCSRLRPSGANRYVRPGPSPDKSPSTTTSPALFQENALVCIPMVRTCSPLRACSQQPQYAERDHSKERQHQKSCLSLGESDKLFVANRHSSLLAQITVRIGAGELVLSALCGAIFLRNNHGQGWRISGDCRLAAAAPVILWLGLW